MVQMKKLLSFSVKLCIAIYFVKDAVIRRGAAHPIRSADTRVAHPRSQVLITIVAAAFETIRVMTDGQYNSNL
jgi:hypothetical protein